MPKLTFKNQKECQQCRLASSRSCVVPGQGSYGRGIFLIGEAPDAEEDDAGRPFIGRSGKLLSRLLREVGLTRKDDYYVTNIVKCRPPGGRDPKPDEVAECKVWLGKELRKIRPWLVIPIGASAAKFVLDDDKFSITSGIGKVYPRILKHLDYHTDDFVLVYPMLHPAYLLRNPTKKHFFKENIQTLMDKVIAKEPHHESV